MSYADSKEKMSALRSQIAASRNQIRELQSEIEPEEVENYSLKTTSGDTSLLALFGDKTDLFVVHNMGASCPYCTLWADGYNGVYEHLANRAAFVVTSPDAPADQKKFAEGRAWRFPIVSHQGTSFASDMGFRGDNGWMPGLSVFKRDGDKVLRVSDVSWGPGDDYCSVWHFLDLIPEGANGWQPQFRYG